MASSGRTGGRSADPENLVRELGVGPLSCTTLWRGRGWRCRPPSPLPGRYRGGREHRHEHPEQVGQRLAAHAAARRAARFARGRDVSPVSVSDGRARQAQAYRLLRAAMATAVVDRVIDEQPCRIAGAGEAATSLGPGPGHRRPPAVPEQVSAVADAMPARYQAPVLAAAWSGLREGELLALTCADLDLDTVPATVRVRRGARRSDTGQIHLDLPKTRASVRTVSLPAPLAAALADHLDEFVGEDAVGTHARAERDHALADALSAAMRTDS